MREWLVKIRKEKNMTQRDVAEKAKISNSYYAMIETGDRRSSVDAAQAIADVLDCDWRLFFPKQTNNPDTA